jgi:hypothetical protein
MCALPSQLAKSFKDMLLMGDCGGTTQINFGLNMPPPSSIKNLFNFLDCYKEIDQIC